mmetsp:Transcript_50559/g.130320  ORF Transcript_50559/g.130320 Transcript_50559/m.130320 type:complete len:1010 (-) Transcript_50559:108-3137(-)
MDELGQRCESAPWRSLCGGALVRVVARTLFWARTVASLYTLIGLKEEESFAEEFIRCCDVLFKIVTKIAEAGSTASSLLLEKVTLSRVVSSCLQLMLFVHQLGEASSEAKALYSSAFGALLSLFSAEMEASTAMSKTEEVLFLWIDGAMAVSVKSEAEKEQADADDIKLEGMEHLLPEDFAPVQRDSLSKTLVSLAVEATELTTIVTSEAEVKAKEMEDQYREGLELCVAALSKRREVLSEKGSDEGDGEQEEEREKKLEAVTKCMGVLNNELKLLPLRREKDGVPVSTVDVFSSAMLKFGRTMNAVERLRRVDELSYLACSVGGGRLEKTRKGIENHVKRVNIASRASKALSRALRFHFLLKEVLINPPTSPIQNLLGREQTVDVICRILVLCRGVGMLETYWLDQLAKVNRRNGQYEEAAMCMSKAVEVAVNQSGLRFGQISHVFPIVYKRLSRLPTHLLSAEADYLSYIEDLDERQLSTCGGGVLRHTSASSLATAFPPRAGHDFTLSTESGGIAVVPSTVSEAWPGVGLVWCDPRGSALNFDGAVSAIANDLKRAFRFYSAHEVYLSLLERLRVAGSLRTMEEVYHNLLALVQTSGKETADASYVLPRTADSGGGEYLMKKSSSGSVEERVARERANYSFYRVGVYGHAVREETGKSGVMYIVRFPDLTLRADAEQKISSQFQASLHVRQHAVVILRDSDTFSEHIESMNPTKALFLHISAVNPYVEEAVEGRMVRDIDLAESVVDTSSPISDLTSPRRLSVADCMLTESVVSEYGDATFADTLLSDLASGGGMSGGAGRSAGEAEPELGMDGLHPSTIVQEDSLQVKLPLIKHGPAVFFFDTAVRADNTVGTTDDARMQYKRRTRLVVPRPFPWIRHWQRVVKVEEYLLSPLENAIEMLSEKAHTINQRLHLEDKVVTQLLFGSIMPLVNGGPVQMTRHFLSEYVPKSSEDKAMVERLRQAVFSFLQACTALVLRCRPALTDNNAVVAVEEAHTKLVKGLAEYL